MTKIPSVKLLRVVFLRCAYAVLLACNDRSNPYLAGTLVIYYIHDITPLRAVKVYGNWREVLFIRLIPSKPDGWAIVL